MARVQIENIGLQNNIKQLNQTEEKLRSQLKERRGSSADSYRASRANAKKKISFAKLSGTADLLPTHASTINRDAKRVARSLKEYKKRDRNNAIITSVSSSSDKHKSDIMYHLPRGGVYVWTKAGAVQVILT